MIKENIIVENVEVKEYANMVNEKNIVEIVKVREYVNME
jgi:hypothetical protein